jgi:hypothetical protein
MVRGLCTFERPDQSVRNGPGSTARRATDREVGVVAAVPVAGSEKAAAHRLGLSHSTVKHHLANARSRVGAETTAQLVRILAQRLPEPDGVVEADEERALTAATTSAERQSGSRRRRGHVVDAISTRADDR